MEKRALGRQGLTASAIGYGAMGTVTAFGPSDDTESIAAIRHAYELGCTLFDTAAAYGSGNREGEKLLGEAVAPFRGELAIATKFGVGEGQVPDSKPQHIRESVDTSLRSLGVDSIDLLYQHLPDPNVPIEDVVGTMKEFVEAGKVKYLALSNADADTIRRAHAVHPISALQSEYSIFFRETEELFPVLEELGIGFVSYSPLARGFLSGAVKSRDELDETDARQHFSWWAPENFAANKEIARQLSEIADEKGVQLSQLALAWTLARKDYIVPIPGSRNIKRVAENVAAADLTLTADDLARIDQLAPNGAVGPRF